MKKSTTLLFLIIFSVPFILSSCSKLTASDGANGDLFGKSASIYRDQIILGAPSDDDNGNNSGAAYIFEKKENEWTEVVKLTEVNGAANNGFGNSVSTFGDLAIVGAVGDDDDPVGVPGSAYIFERNEETWSQVKKITASDATTYNGFGKAVSIYGERVVIGAAIDDDDPDVTPGAVYIFEKIGGTWTEVTKLTSSDGSYNNGFGISVSVSGDYIIVGVPFDRDKGYSSGAVEIFEKINGTWTNVKKITASDGTAFENFGINVSISGDQAIIGADEDKENGDNSGAAYIIERIGGAWTQVAKLTTTVAAPYTAFGCSVSIHGDRVIVGACGGMETTLIEGSAYIFEKIDGTWTQTLELNPSDKADYVKFGSAVSIFDNQSVVGAKGDDDYGDHTGVAYVYDLSILSTVMNDITK